MSGFLDKCLEYFESKDFYEILDVKKDATDKQIKKAYHKLSLRVHPDRVDENKKLEATEKFKVLGKIHSILQDGEKRKVYDETGDFDDEDLDADEDFNWLNYWRSMFRKITKKDIENYEKEYVGSADELRDIKKAYIASKGKMDTILDYVPFSSCESEPRIIEIVRKMVDDGEIEEYDCFFNEPKKKKERRFKKWEEDKKEVAEIDDDELEMAIQQNHQKRESEFQNLLSNLESKYAPKKGGAKRKSIDNGGNKRTRKVKK